MARFHDLDVIAVEKTIRDAVVVSLKPRDAAVFAFKPGQYLTFSKDFDGVEVRRSYSICVPPGEGYLQVGIKTVDGGAFQPGPTPRSRPAARCAPCRPRAASSWSRTRPPAATT